ncbi:MAG: two-component sensor histidine kinase, partial [Bacteroidota bacterium]|nr:two-component sensor histidine kinase [Bacteroidota bacterium]
MITIAYWFLLVYILVALVFWYFELQRQNQQMYQYRLEQLKKEDTGFRQQLLVIEDAKHRKTSQYIGEGATFLFLILLGAVFVYRATRKQLLLSQQQQNFMMAVTHEFKTPIAVTRLNLETLQKRKLEEAQQQKLISNTLQETARLNTLTNNILISSQLEAGAYE